MEPTRERAWETLTKHTQSEALLRHALAVEASTAWYARHFGEGEELWRVVALLHDFDYEIHPTLDKYPQDGALILRELLRGLGAEQVVAGDRDVLNGAVLEAASLPGLPEGAAPAGAFPCC